MSAEILRRAAALMRERAEAATSGPWESAVEDAQADMPPDYAIWMPEVGHDGALVESEADAEHIASWHPDVALAVADLLDVWADNDLLGSHFTLPEEIACITDLANTYLGEPS